MVFAEAEADTDMVQELEGSVAAEEVGVTEATLIQNDAFSETEQ